VLKGEFPSEVDWVSWEEKRVYFSHVYQKEEKQKERGAPNHASILTFKMYIEIGLPRDGRKKQNVKGPWWATKLFSPTTQKDMKKKRKRRPETITKKPPNPRDFRQRTEGGLLTKKKAGTKQKWGGHLTDKESGGRSAKKENITHTPWPSENKRIRKRGETPGKPDKGGSLLPLKGRKEQKGRERSNSPGVRGYLTKADILG